MLDDKSLILDLAVNLGQIGKFAMEGNTKRVKQFMLEVDKYLLVLAKRNLKTSVRRPLHIYESRNIQ